MQIKKNRGVNKQPGKSEEYKVMDVIVFSSGCFLDITLNWNTIIVVV